jgi:hypothetical protein
MNMFRVSKRLTLTKLLIIGLSGVLFLTAEASARIYKPQSISLKGARNICSGHGPHGNSSGGWSCGFCGKINCTNVSCDKNSKCNVTIVTIKANPVKIRTPITETKAPPSSKPTPHPVRVGIHNPPHSVNTPIAVGKGGGMNQNGSHRR